MTSAEIEDGLYESLGKSRSTTLAALRAEAGAGGTIDSLEGVELLMAAETTFGIHFADAEITSQVCRSVSKIADLIATKLGS